MSREPPTICSAVRDYHPDRDRAGEPATVCGDLRCEPAALIGLAHELVHVNDLGLHFDDQQGPRRGMPGEQIDYPALPVDRERDLRGDLPVAKLPEHGGHGLMHGRVAGIQEPIEVSGVPPRNEVDSHIERFKHAPKTLQGDASELPSLDPGNRRAGHSRSASQIVLSPALAHAKRSDDVANHRVRHGLSLQTCAHPGLTGRRCRFGPWM